MDMKKLSTKFTEIQSISKWLWEKGWAEQNAGNLSINVTSEIDINKNALGLYDFVEMEIPYENLDGQAFIVSATGARFRDMAEDPTVGILVIFISIEQGGYYIISHDDIDIRPSSEFISHLAMQSYFLEIDNDRKAILHTHPTNIIAMTHLPEIHMQNELNRAIWKMHTESPVFLYDGVGLGGFAVPGSKELADISKKLLEDHRIVVWPQHGALATSPTLTECFDLLDITEKCAEIYIKAKSCGSLPTGMTDEQIVAIREFWKV
ncbi:MAG: rhamnulose-1-phosphate aldolase [Candidatus Zixiibacteriota bacterium]